MSVLKLVRIWSMACPPESSAPNCRIIGVTNCLMRAILSPGRPFSKMSNPSSSA